MQELSMEEHFEAANTCLVCSCGSVKWHIRADNAIECSVCGLTDDYIKKVLKKTLKLIADEVLKIT